MIDRASIMQWNEHAPWIYPSMVEQDLIICRALVCIFSDEFLADKLAFRGGTALHKLFLTPQFRYSEDIDLVQIHPGPIKPIMYRLGEVLSWMPDKVTKQKRYKNTMLFRMESEVPPVEPLRLKVEMMQDNDFLSDMNLLIRVGAPHFDPTAAYEKVKTTFLDMMPGNRD